MNDSRYASFRVAPEGDGLPPQRQVSDRLCGCGCGQYTLIADRNRGGNGSKRGLPLRYLRGHNGGRTTGHQRRPSLPTCRPCTPATLTVCAECGVATHLHNRDQDKRTCVSGHPSMMGRGLCGACYYQAARAGALADYPRVKRSRDELLEEWEWLAGTGVGFAEFPARVGVTYLAWERAFYRARAAGDPRAVRAGEERCAA